MPDVLVPHYPRVCDYFGLWAIEESAFRSLWDLHRRTDLFAHLRSAAPARMGQSMTEQVPGKGGKNIAVISAGGMLMKQTPSMGGTSTVQLRRDVRAAAADPNVSGILLRVDSPGGTVAGTADLAAEVRSARKKKPTWALVEDLGASAAYWVASQADQVFAANPTTLVGSIGTYQVVYDTSAMAEQQGVKVHRIATGPLKGIGVDGTPVTDEQVAHLQALANDAQTHFDAAVRSGRALTKTQLDAVRTGGAFTAASAAERRLIDGVRGLDATLAALAEAR